MAIAIRGSTPGTSGLVVTSTTSVTVSGARQPQSGDVLIIVHCNDFYALTNIPTLCTVGGSTTGVTAITNGAGDAGTNQAHMRSWYYVAGSTGDLTVAVAETGTGDEEKHLAVWVLSGADNASPIDIAGTSAATAVTANHVAPSVTATSSDAFLVSTAVSANNTSLTYTPPSGMAEAYDTANAFSAYTAASVQLVASGATGTKTFVLTGNSNSWAAQNVAVKTASGGGAAVVPIIVMPPRRP
jgi:hypothetical protein